jgi:hypothetical protein
LTRQKEMLAITTPHVAGDEDIGAIRNIVGFHIRLAHGAVYRISPKPSRNSTSHRSRCPFSG